MPLPLQSTAKLQITPLLDIQHEDVAHAYREGFLDHSQANNHPLAVRNVVNCIQAAIEQQWFDRRHDAQLRCFIGFLIGEVHGKVVSANGTCQPDVTTLVKLNNDDEQRGYQAGRLWYFYEATASERFFSEDELLNRLHEYASDSPLWSDPDGVWSYNIACLLGELSGHLFPLTAQEQQYWEAEYRWFSESIK